MDWLVRDFVRRASDGVAGADNAPTRHSTRPARDAFKSLSSSGKRPVKFISTRSNVFEGSFVDVVFGGLAPDGGLWMPATIPSGTARAANLPFPDLVASVVAPYARGMFSEETLATIARDVYAPERFPHEAIAPLTQIGPDDWVLELFHGPSLAFKDFALAMIGGVWDEWLRIHDRRVTALVATSGDTGGAAAAALAGKRNIDLVVLHPKGRISEIQRRFMTALDADNILNLAIEADFDICQALVKTLLVDGGSATSGSLASTFRFSAVNSINWLRIATQAAYFFRAGQILRRPFEVIVPTGNFGNALSALVARAMGAPIGRIVAACNDNDFVTRVIETGFLRRENSRATLAPAMDIQIPSNLERALFLAAGSAADAIATLYSTFEKTGEVKLPDSARAWMTEHFGAARASDHEILTAMAAVHRSTGPILCPHSAAGVVAAQKTARSQKSATRVVLATAHPAKFPETVRRAIGVTPPIPVRAAAIVGAQERMTMVDADAKAVRNAITAFVDRQRA